MTPRNKFWAFCSERERIRVLKECNVPAPLTNDERLANYWFPNLRRMDDPTTVWLHGALLSTLKDPEQIILATVACRLFGSQETMEAIGPVFWGSGYWEEGFLDAVRGLEKPFNSRLQPHLRSRDLRAATSTLSSLQAEHGRWHLLRGASLRGATEALCGVRGIGPELAYEIVCDLRWTPVLEMAPDALRWALPGLSTTKAAGTLLRRELRSTRAADRAATVELMQDLLRESGCEDWEMSEVQRALTLFHFYNREKRPTRSYKCT
ncbi:MAG: hypothetical protein GY906_12270 [bacterium]|nr:hypothetical protein [bacterium]